MGLAIHKLKLAGDSHLRKRARKLKKKEHPEVLFKVSGRRGKMTGDVNKRPRSDSVPKFF
ncbi:hypothetical protein MicloDRAFT_00049950 [Microvirga lotononidis]|uniref:Uncharacterized protein n=1 Tax=Microvirga lotononidis TaxID=864069 RepID=I4YWS0_9HYPH|nr:hypothetical protein MicloDRAFT_00049950 [Microvirga lotononidis]